MPVPSYTTAEIAERVHGELRGRADLPIAGVNALDEASEGEITFIADSAHASRWSETGAGAAVISHGIEARGHDPSTRALIVVPSAQLTVIELLHLFAPPPAVPDIGVHGTADVHPDATLGSDVRVGPHVTIAPGASIGDRVVLHAGVRLYAEVRIGDDSIVHANSVIRERCHLGRRVLLHQNVSIGGDGFGFERAPDGSSHLRVPHIGIVEIADDVEIGAGSCIDRGKFGSTTIGEGTKIDNLVQIGHNCRIGRRCLIAALCGLSGSVSVGEGVILAGAVGVANHVTIGSGVMIGAQAGIMRDIAAGKRCVGSPAIEVRQFFRQFVALQRLPAFMREVSRRLGKE